MKKLLLINLVLPLLLNGQTNLNQEVVIQNSHTKEITCASFSPDSKWLVTGSEDGTVKLWNINGSLIRTFVPPALKQILYEIPEIPAVDISPNGDKIAAFRDDGYVFVWDINGELLNKTIVRSKYFPSLKYSSDGEILLAVLDPSEIYILDSKGNLINKVEKKLCENCDFENKGLEATPDGNFVMAVKRRNLGNTPPSFDYLIYKISRKGEILSCTGYSPLDDEHINVSHNKEKIIVGCYGFMIYDLNRRPLKKIELSLKGFCNIWFSPDQKYWIYSQVVENKAGERLHFGEIRDYNGLVVRTLGRPLGKAEDVSLTQDQNLFGLMLNNQACYFDFNSLNPVNIPSIDAYNKTISFSTNSSDSDNGVYAAAIVRDIKEVYKNNLAFLDENGNIFSQSELKSGNMYINLHFSPNGKYIVGLNKDSHGDEMYLFNLKGKKYAEMSGKRAGWDSRPITNITFASDGNTFLTLSMKGIIIWNSKGGKEVVIPQETINRKDISKQALIWSVFSASLSPDGNTIFVACDSNFITLDKSGKEFSRVPAPKELRERDDVSFKDAVFSPDGKMLAAKTHNNEIAIVLKDGSLLKILRGHSAPVCNIMFTPDNKRIVSTAEDNTLRYWDIESGESIIFLSDQDDWIAYTPDGYYDASKNGGKLVGLTIGNLSFGIDQFAAKYNRPDIILKRFNLGTPELISHFENQYQKRLRKLGITEDQITTDFHIPVVQIINSATADKFTAITANFSDDKYSLKSYNIFLNDVPLYGAYGKIISGNNVNIFENLELTKGNNKIEISCVNEKGAESYRALTYATYNGETKGNLYFLAFGVSKYQNSSYNLQFADKDALDLEKVMQSFKDKGFENVYTKVLTNEQVTPDAIRATKDFVKNAKPDDTFILFIAGHGIHDTDPEATYYFLTSNADLKNLKGTAADFETIEDLLQGIPPRNKLFLMDACESGEIDEEEQGQMMATATGVGINSRGFKTVSANSPQSIANSPQTAKRTYLYQKDRYIYNDLVRRSGAIVFSSSKGGELSYERSDIENGLFTEYIIKALTTNEADKDGNGFVSTDELRQYVSEHVAKASGDLQHPTVDRDNIYQKFGFHIK